MKALVNIKKFEYQGFPFSSWLYRIAINEVNMHYRKVSKTRDVALDDSNLKPILDDLELGYEEDEYDALIEGLNELSEEQVSLIELRFFEKRSFKEMGGILGISEGNAKIRLYRSVKTLRKIVFSKFNSGNA